jgi:hypothetical protein
VHLDEAMIRMLMAQSALPHIAGRVVSVRCPKCLRSHFDKAENAFTPHTEHYCETCGSKFRSLGRMRKTIGNPMIGILAELGRNASRPPRQHRSQLLVETI